jgi:DNA-directed RNA polymerase beta subunit
MGGDGIGFVDASSCTEGATCGLMLELANMVRVRGIYSPHVIRSVVSTLQREFESEDGVNLFVNGYPMWRTARPKELCAALRNMRRKSHMLPYDVGIAWIGRNPRLGIQGHIRVSCDPGEMVAPHFVVDELYRVKELFLTLQHMPASDMVNMLASLGIVEYVGSEEQNCDIDMLTAPNVNDAIVGEHMWAVLSPSVSIFGPNSTLTPGADHNQGPRNSYICIDADAEIVMADGTTKTMRNLIVGDVVQSYNTISEEICEETVTDVITQPKEVRDMISILVRVSGKSDDDESDDDESDDDESDDELTNLKQEPYLLNLTANHLVYTKEIGWMSAGSLRPFVKASDRKGEKLHIGIKMADNQDELTWHELDSSYRFQSEMAVMDIALTGESHLFFANRIAVHNSNMIRQVSSAVTPATFGVRAGKTQTNLMYPQKPIVTTVGADILEENKYPSGAIAYVAMGSLNNFTIEDALVVRRESIQLGFGMICETRTYEAQEFASSSDETKIMLPDFSICKNLKAKDYSKINPLTGVPDVGTVLTSDCIIIAIQERRKQKQRRNDLDEAPKKAQPKKAKKADKKKAPKKRKVNLLSTDDDDEQQHLEEAAAAAAAAAAAEEGEEEEEEEEGGRGGGGGGCTKQSQYSFSCKSIAVKSKEGTVIVDSVISTTTIDGNRLVKVRTRQIRNIEEGDKLTDSNAQKGVVGAIWKSVDMPDALYQILEDIDMNTYGVRTMYDGMTGEIIGNMVSCGYASMLRLNHLTAKKIHSRGRDGPRLSNINQPTEGRQKDGGIRTGEMERDAMLGHGTSFVLQDRLSITSDGSEGITCPNCGNLPERIFPNMDPRDPTSYACRVCVNSVIDGSYKHEKLNPPVKTYNPTSAFVFNQLLGALQVGVSYQVSERGKAL